MKKTIRITETYTYDIDIDVDEFENIDDVIHETENIRFMNDETFNKISNKDTYNAELEYEIL